jgi:nicotinamide phosphoribosyltransferase
MKPNALSVIDFYKANHINFYDEGTEMLYQNFTPRSTKYLPKAEGLDNKVVLFGLQYYMKWYLIDLWNETFFQRDKPEVVRKFKRRMDNALGADTVPTAHLEALHDLGYLPILIKALPEGTAVNQKIPYFTIKNTDKRFAWLVGYLEDSLSNSIWRASTSATIARKYKLIGLKYAKETGVDEAFVNFQFHDFALRGTAGMQDACLTGSGHLTSFVGTDNVPAIDFVEDYYGANSDTELVGCSVAANEHSCVCSGGKDNEFANYKKWITVKFPKGIVSLVSDTWSLWNVITNYMPALKDDIMKRDGKVVLRPDSSPKTPLEIICGDPDAAVDSPEYKGAIRLLWEIFGGTVNEKGFKVLDPHIGLIYGEAITLNLAPKIFEKMKEMGFASSNILYGIGSFSYVYCTRDSCGWACKATACIVNGEFREIFKDPITDTGMKKSAKGYLRVDKIDGEFVLKDQCTEEEEKGGELIPVFENGKLLKDYTLQEIRNNVALYS